MADRSLSAVRVTPLRFAATHLTENVRYPCFVVTSAVADGLLSVTSVCADGSVYAQNLFVQMDI